MKNILEEVLSIEKKLVKYIIGEPLLLKRFKPPSNKLSSVEKINFMLLNNDKYNIEFQIHKFLISKIIYYYFFKEKKIPIERLSKYFYCFNYDIIDSIPLEVNTSKITKNLKTKDLIKLLELMHNNFLSSNLVFYNGGLISKKSRIKFRYSGSVYTDRKISNKITYKTIKNKIKEGFEKNELRILDFGCGTGRFYISAFNFLSSNLKIDKRKIIEKNLFAIDNDPIALDILKIKIYSIFNSNDLKILKKVCKNVIQRNMLITEKIYEGLKPVNYQKDFKDVMSKGGFNIIISNPPYVLLKINKKSKQDNNVDIYYDNLTKKIKRELDFFRNSGIYKKSIQGMLNYYKLSIEMMLKISSEEAEIGIICPSTIFADLSSSKLRKHILLENRLREVNYFPESSKLFDNITQSTVIFYLQKGGRTKNIKVKINGSKFNVPLELIKNTFSKNYEIPFISRTGWSIIEKLSNFNKLKYYKHIKNRRGELDLTLHKKYITTKNTGWKLIRGNMIVDKKIKHDNKQFVLDKFLNCKPKNFVDDILGKKRLICQQISNIDKKKRLNFVFSGEKDIIANSCNYIFSNDIEELKKLEIILNSYLINWRFKAASSNNHINNYEVAELPIIDLKNICVDDNELKRNINIGLLYGLNKKEIKFILKDFFDDNVIDKEMVKNK